MNARRTLTILAVLLAAAQWAGAAGTINPVQEYIMSTFSSAAQGGSGKLDYHTVTNVETKLLGQRALLRFDGPQWVFTNSWNVATNVDVSIDPGTRISVGTNAILTLNTNWVDWSRQPIFTGLGTVTGAVRCNVSYHPVWSNTVSHYYLTGGTLNGTNTYLTDLTEFGGDVYGTYDNLQIKTGVVTTVEILDYTILNEDMATGAVDTVTILDGTIGTNDLSTRVTSLLMDSYWFNSNVKTNTTVGVAMNGWNLTNNASWETASGPGTAYWINGGSTTGWYFRTPKSGLWHFYNYTLVTPGLLVNTTNTMGCMVWSDADQDRTLDFDDPQFYGSFQTINFGATPWSGLTYAPLTFTSEFTYYLASNEIVQPSLFLYHQPLGSATMTGFQIGTNNSGVFDNSAWWVFGGNLLQEIP